MVLRPVSNRDTHRHYVAVFGVADEKVAHHPPAAWRGGQASGVPVGIGACLAACARPQVILCGFEAHICIYQSALALHEAGNEVFAVVDAVSSRSMGDKDTALQDLARHGVRLVSTEMALFALLRDAAHPAFKVISALLK